MSHSMLAGSTTAMTSRMPTVLPSHDSSHVQRDHRGRELMHEFNRASVDAAPNKRKRIGEGQIYEQGKVNGESMYHNLVTRDTAPHDHYNTGDRGSSMAEKVQMSCGATIQNHSDERERGSRML